MKKNKLFILLFVIFSFAFISSVNAAEYTIYEGKCVQKMGVGVMKYVDSSFCEGIETENTEDDVSYENYSSSTVSCGDGTLKMSPTIPKVTSIIYLIIQIAVPVVLVIIGSIDLLKAITASKDDEISKQRNLLVKKIISAALVFFVMAIVKLVIGLAADNSKILSCADCIIKNKCS